MSEILSLAQRFEAKSKQQAIDTEKALRSEFEQHRRFISEALRSSEETTRSAILAQNRRVRALLLKGWLWMALSLALAFSASAGALWWTGERIADNLRQLDQQREALSLLQQQTFGIRLIENANGRFIQLPEGYTADTGWTLNKGRINAVKLVKE